LSYEEVANPGAQSIDHIMDYAAGDMVDLTQVLNLAAGTNPIAGGYLRVTTSGLIQVDVDGGANSWVTLSTINGSGSVAVRYLAGGTATNQSVDRVSDSSATLLAANSDQPGMGDWSISHHLSADLLGFN
jgi:hypothetical protein